MKRKTFGVIIRSSPYGTRQGKDALDLILALSAFEQNILVVFEQAGLLHLTASVSDHQQIKAYAKEWLALPMYDVNNIVVVREDWQNLHAAVLPAELNVREIDRALLAEEIARCDVVLQF